MARPSPSQVNVRCSLGTVALWDWSPSLENPEVTVVFIHATGFHSRCWDQVIRHLPDTFRCVCVDVPGHGHSSAFSEVSWRTSAEAVAEGLDAIKPHVGRVSVLVGHSMGGHIAISIAASSKGRFPSLLLIDPVVQPVQVYSDTSAIKRREGMRNNASKRKAFFKDAHEMFDRFHDRFPYATWQTSVLRDYCNHGLGQPGPDGSRKLLCAPEIEGAYYWAGSIPDADLSPELEVLKKRKQVVTLLRAPKDPENRPFRGSPTDPGLATRLGENAVDVVLQEMNHFIPMVAPQVVAQYVHRLAMVPSRL